MESLNAVSQRAVLKNPRSFFVQISCKMNSNYQPALDQSGGTKMSALPTNPEITSDDKLWALLSYLFPIIAIVVLLMEDKKVRPFIKFYAVQALAATVVLSILATVTFGCGSILFLARSIGRSRLIRVSTLPSRSSPISSRSKAGYNLTAGDPEACATRRLFSFQFF